MRNREDIEEALNDLEGRVPEMFEDAEVYDEAVDIMERLLKNDDTLHTVHEEVFQQKVDSVVHHLYQSGDTEKTFAYAAEVKGYTYFENFLETGELGKVLKALERNGLSPDVLKIVTKGTQPDTFVHPSIDFKVTQIVERVKGSSPVIVYFAMTYNGKTIYEFGEKGFRNINTEMRDGESSEEFTQRIIKEGRQKKRVSTYSGTVEMSDGTIYKKWVDKNGRTFYTNWKGYRVKI